MRRASGLSPASGSILHGMSRWGVLVLVGCGSQPAAPIANEPAPVVPIDSIALPSIDLGTELKAIATARVPKPVEEVGPGEDQQTEITELSAFGPCTRPDRAEQTALRARIEGWLRVRYPREAFDADDVTALGFGCRDRAGVVVDVVVDTRPKEWVQRPGPPTLGRWLTVRVAPSGITTLIDTKGIPSIMGGEWAVKTTQRTLALADFDKDGAFDVVSVNEVWEVGDVRHYLKLTTVTSSGATATFGPFSDHIELAPQPLAANRAVVIRVKDDAEVETILRCVDGSPQLATACPELAAARRLVEAELAAATLATGPDRTVFDRDEVTELVTLFDVPEPRRSALIEAAPVKPSRVVAREVQRFARRERGTDVMLTHERAEVRRQRANRESAVSFAELGDAECAPGVSTPALAAKVSAWVAANNRALISKAIAANASLAEACKQSPCALDRPTPATVSVPCEAGTTRYVIASWNTRTARANDPPQILRSALLFVTGDKIGHVLDIAEPAPMCCTTVYSTSVDAAFYRRGNALLATVIRRLDSNTNELVTVVGGVVGERRTGNFERYPIRPLLVDRATDGSVWHAGPALHRVASVSEISLGGPPTSRSPIEALIAERELHAQAREALVGVQDLGSAADRASTIEALTVLGAPTDLIERVRDTR